MVVEGERERGFLKKLWQSVPVAIAVATSLHYLHFTSCLSVRWKLATQNPNIEGRLAECVVHRERERGRGLPPSEWHPYEHIATPWETHPCDPEAKVMKVC